MDSVSLLTAALTVLGFWLIACLPLVIAWVVAHRRRMPREARASFIWLCLLASHGIACLVAVVLLPLAMTRFQLVAAMGPVDATGWSWRLGQCLQWAALGLPPLAAAVMAVVLPLRLCRVWPAMRAAARMHAWAPGDPAERHA